MTKSFFKDQGETKAEKYEASADKPDEGKPEVSGSTEHGGKPAEFGGGNKPHVVGDSNIGKRDAHGFGHTGAQKAGPLRLSGHKGAHRIGKK